MMQIGRDEGRIEGIHGMITALKSLGYDNILISEKLMEIYNLSYDEAKDFLSN